MGANFSKPDQESPKDSKEKGRDSKAKRLGFSWIPSSDSGLFNGLVRIQAKRFSCGIYKHIVHSFDPQFSVEGASRLQQVFGSC
jgi:hypothetical protein